MPLPRFLCRLSHFSRLVVFAGSVIFLGDERSIIVLSNLSLSITHVLLLHFIRYEFTLSECRPLISFLSCRDCIIMLIPQVVLNGSQVTSSPVLTLTPTPSVSEWILDDVRLHGGERLSKLSEA